MKPVLKPVSLPLRPQILIVLMGSLGDIARGLCLVSQIKRVYPEGRLSWLVESRWVEFVRLHAQIDEVLVFQRELGVMGALRLWKDMRRHAFDVTLDLQRHLKSGLCSLSSGAKLRIGFHPADTKEFNFIFNNHYIAACGEEIPKVLHYLKFLEVLGIEVCLPLDFGLSGIDPSAVIPAVLEQINGPYVVLVLGSSRVVKNWTKEGYQGLIAKLLEDGRYRPVLVGDGSCVGLAHELEREGGILNLAGRTSLPELVALLKGAAAAVGPDSGPGHVAAAVGVPYVALIGPTNAARVAPYGCENFVVEVRESCSPCGRRRCSAGHERSMRNISAEMVWEKLSLVLSRWET